MALTERDLLEPISDFIFAATNERPYPSLENINLPQSDFISVRIVNTKPVSHTHTYKTFPSDTGIPEFYTQYTMTVKVTAYGEQAFGWIHGLTYGLRNPYIRNALGTKMAYMEHTEPRETSIPINETKIEKRYSMSILFSFVSGDPNPGGSEDCIETVDPATYVGDLHY